MANEVSVKILKLEHFDESFSLPTYASAEAAGADLRASFHGKGELIIGPGERVCVPTGLIFELPMGYELQIRPRSGLSLKTSLMVVNSPGTIDSDYRGEVKIILGNLGHSDEIIRHGDRVAQAVLAPVYHMRFNLVVDRSDLRDTVRGEQGLGHTGIQ